MDQLTAPGRVEFFVQVEPRGKGRPRASVVFKPGRKLGVHMRNTPEDAAFEAEISRAAEYVMRGRPPIASPVALTVTAVCAVPQSWSKAKRGRALVGEEAPTGRPDLSNIVKGVEDGMNGIAYRDDAQIVMLTALKRFGETPGLFIQVEALDKKGGA